MSNPWDISEKSGEASTQNRTQVRPPPLYKVLLFNDDYTTMDFVVDVLQKFFRKSFEEATRLMLQIHEQGRAVCGVYPREIAETKVLLVIDYSRRHEHPLQCGMEEA